MSGEIFHPGDVVLVASDRSGTLWPAMIIPEKYAPENVKNMKPKSSGSNSTTKKENNSKGEASNDSQHQYCIRYFYEQYYDWKTSSKLTHLTPEIALNNLSILSIKIISKRDKKNLKKYNGLKNSYLISLKPPNLKDFQKFEFYANIPKNLEILPNCSALPSILEVFNKSATEKNKLKKLMASLAERKQKEEEQQVVVEDKDEVDEDGDEKMNEKYGKVNDINNVEIQKTNPTIEQKTNPVEYNHRKSRNSSSKQLINSSPKPNNTSSNKTSYTSTKSGNTRRTRSLISSQEEESNELTLDELISKKRKRNHTNNEDTTPTNKISKKSIKKEIKKEIKKDPFEINSHTVRQIHFLKDQILKYQLQQFEKIKYIKDLLLTKLIKNEPQEEDYNEIIKNIQSLEFIFRKFDLEELKQLQRSNVSEENNKVEKIDKINEKDNEKIDIHKNNESEKDENNEIENDNENKEKEKENNNENENENDNNEINDNNEVKNKRFEVIEQKMGSVNNSNINVSDKAHGEENQEQQDNNTNIYPENEKNKTTLTNIDLTNDSNDSNSNNNSNIITKDNDNDNDNGLLKQIYNLYNIDIKHQQILLKLKKCHISTKSHKKNQRNQDMKEETKKLRLNIIKFNIILYLYENNLTWGQILTRTKIGKVSKVIEFIPNYEIENLNTLYKEKVILKNQNNDHDHTCSSTIHEAMNLCFKKWEMIVDEECRVLKRLGINYENKSNNDGDKKDIIEMGKYIRGPFFKTGYDVNCTAIEIVTK